MELRSIIGTSVVSYLLMRLNRISVEHCSNIQSAVILNLKWEILHSLKADLSYQKTYLVWETSLADLEQLLRISQTHYLTLLKEGALPRQSKAPLQLKGSLRGFINNTNWLRRKKHFRYDLNRSKHQWKSQEIQRLCLCLRSWNSNNSVQFHCLRLTIRSMISWYLKRRHPWGAAD